MPARRRRSPAERNSNGWGTRHETPLPSPPLSGETPQWSGPSRRSNQDPVLGALPYGAAVLPDSGETSAGGMRRRRPPLEIFCKPNSATVTENTRARFAAGAPPCSLSSHLAARPIVSSSTLVCSAAMPFTTFAEPDRRARSLAGERRMPGPPAAWIAHRCLRRNLDALEGRAEGQ